MGELLNGYRIPFGAMKMFWDKTEKVVVKHYECLNDTELFTLKSLFLCSMNFTSINKADTRDSPRQDSISEQAVPQSDWKGV